MIIIKILFNILYNSFFFIYIINVYWIQCRLIFLLIEIVNLDLYLLLFIYLLISFLVKISLYIFYGWLLNAHVEAFYYSIILASIILYYIKIIYERYEILWLIIIFKLIFNYVNNFLIIINLFRVLVLRLTCQYKIYNSNFISCSYRINN